MVLEYSIWLNKKVFHSYKYLGNLEELKEEFPSKNKFYSSLSGKETSDTEYQLVSKVWNKLEIKKMKYYLDLHLKCDFYCLMMYLKHSEADA